MKKIIFILFIVPLLSFGQSKKFKKDYKRELKNPSFLFITDWRESNYDNILYKNKNILSKIISKSAKYGYKLWRNGNDFIFNDGVFKFVILKKDIFTYNYEGFHSNSIGTVYKKFYFSKETIDAAIIVKVETEIALIEHEHMNASTIMQFFEEFKNFVKRSYLNRYNLESSSQKYDIQSMWGKYYDLVDVFKIWRINKPINDSKNERVLSIGNGTELITYKDGSSSNRHKLVFSIESTLTSSLESFLGKIQTQTKESYSNLRFKIGGKDIRESNIYDLKSMINIFLADCKKNNITIPQTTNFQATFESLEGNTIALSYGFKNDSEIVIKVDPEKWANASDVKRWYVLYHELGHDVLNLEHGEGGKMMFNFADREYSWNDFFTDKDYMFNFVKQNNG